MLDTLRPLAVFAKTVETGSFRAAALALGLSPSVVSHHVARLEARLGTALLYRSTRRLAPTRAGERLLGAARAMVEAAEAGLDALAGEARQPAGRLVVTAPAVLTAGALVDDLAAFAADHPRVVLDATFTDARQDVIAGGIDLAIRMGRMADSSLKSVALGAARRVLVAAPAYVAARARPRRPGDLAGWDWLHLSPVPRRQAFRRAGAVETIAYAPRLAADSAIALFRLAESGLGLAAGPDFLAAPAIRAGRLVLVLPRWSLGEIGIHAVWPPQAPRAGLTRRLVDFLVARGRRRRGP